MSILLFLIFTLAESYYLDPKLNMKRKREAELFCPQETITCVLPLKYSDTERFKCDDLCPFGYKCCPDSCFQHKICKKGDSSLGSCPVEKNPCFMPLACEETEEFLCLGDNDCPSGYTCCEDSCFMHKICKEVSTTVEITTPFATTTQEGTSPTFTTTEKEDTTPPISTVTETEEETSPILITTEIEGEKSSTISSTTEEETSPTLTTTETEDDKSSTISTTIGEEDETSDVSTTTEEEYVENYDEEEN